MGNKKKRSKNRGSRTHGRGGGKGGGRGSGERGGVGGAGRYKHERLKYVKQGIPDGPEPGFNRPQHLVEEPETINVGRLSQEAAELGDASGEIVEVDLTELGIDRLLGKGKVLNPVRVVVGHATENARRKIEAAGGEVVTPTEEEPADDES